VCPNVQHGLDEERKQETFMRKTGNYLQVFKQTTQAKHGTVKTQKSM